MTLLNIAEICPATRRGWDNAVEIHMRHDGALMVGIPPHNFSQDFRQAVELAAAKPAEIVPRSK